MPSPRGSFAPSTGGGGRYENISTGSHHGGGRTEPCRMCRQGSVSDRQRQRAASADRDQRLTGRGLGAARTGASRCQARVPGPALNGTRCARHWIYGSFGDSIDACPRALRTGWTSERLGSMRSRRIATPLARTAPQSVGALRSESLLSKRRAGIGSNRGWFRSPQAVSTGV